MTPMFLTLNEAASALQLHPVTRPVSRELFDPARQRGGSLHGGTRKHVAASGESAVMDPIRDFGERGAQRGGNASCRLGCSDSSPRIVLP
jgi:hypothetical protein